MSPTFTTIILILVVILIALYLADTAVWFVKGGWLLILLVFIGLFEGLKWIGRKVIGLGRGGK